MPPQSLIPTARVLSRSQFEPPPFHAHARPCSRHPFRAEGRVEALAAKPRIGRLIGGLFSRALAVNSGERWRRWRRAGGEAVEAWCASMSSPSGGWTVELSTYLRTTPNLSHELEGAWDSALLSHLLHVENVWGVLITNGAGEIVYSELQRALPDNCPDLLDLTASAVSHSGDRLQVGRLRFTVFMFSGALVVGRHTESGASAFILASPEANLGQLLAHIRKVHLGGEAWGEGQS